MKALYSFITLSLLTLPLAVTLAYAPPCERGDFYVGGDCLDRKQAQAQQVDILQRRSERLERTAATRRTKKEEVRTFYVHPTSVRKENRERAIFRGISHSSRVQVPVKQVELNLRRLRTGIRGENPAVTRRDLSPSSRWTRRTKQENFLTPGSQNEDLR